MNTTKITYFIHSNVDSAPTGNCKTIASAKALANKHGVSVIYARHDGVSVGIVMMKRQAIGWSFQEALEECFAKPETQARVDGKQGMKRIDWTAEPNTVTVRPSVSEPLGFSAGVTNMKASLEDTDRGPITSRANRFGQSPLYSATLEAWVNKNPTTLELALRKPRDQFQGISEADICERASDILKARYAPSVNFTSPQSVVRYLRASLEHLESEQFHVLFLDSQHKLIKSEVLFKGTIDGSAVYPREVVKAALAANAAAVVFAHNHPSGVPEASGADKSITTRLVAALKTVDIKCLDHIIIGGGEFTSFAQKGWL
tara:strand:- start:12774 stop:13721 length:948 start_codon:yes stop_codon:yes gene_type:complete